MDLKAVLHLKNGFFWLLLYTLLLLLEVISAPGCSLSTGRAVFEKVYVLLRLQVNPIEAGFLVACLARRNFRWLARYAPLGVSPDPL
jgi:hypothetical protein